jgi:fructosamine-3-kinase
MPNRTFRKAGRRVPPGYFAWEAAGLEWLAAAAGGAEVARVLDVQEHELILELLTPIAPSRDQAEAFGAALAETHRAGAQAYGSPPDGWSGDGWLGPLTELLPLSLTPVDSWSDFYAYQRLEPVLRAGLRRGTFDEADAALVEKVVARVSDGKLDTSEPPARLHGDLWSGNIIWTLRGGVLIDPAAHGGNREADLAFLQLFGAPHLDAILGAYLEAAPLVEGWQERISLHQLHPLLLHAVLFGGGYVGQSLAVARRWS